MPTQQQQQPQQHEIALTKTAWATGCGGDNRAWWVCGSAGRNCPHFTTRWCSTPHVPMRKCQNHVVGQCSAWLAVAAFRRVPHCVSSPMCCRVVCWMMCDVSLHVPGSIFTRTELISSPGYLGLRPRTCTSEYE